MCRPIQPPWQCAPSSADGEDSTPHTPQATIVGEVIDANVSPPLLAVTEVREGDCDGYNVTEIESTCGNAGTIVSTPVSEYETRVIAHGTLMLLSWGFLLPAGAVLARFFKHREPLWFHCHRSVQVVGLVRRQPQPVPAACVPALIALTFRLCPSISTPTVTAPVASAPYHPCPYRPCSNRPRSNRRRRPHAICSTWLCIDRHQTVPAISHTPRSHTNYSHTQGPHHAPTRTAYPHTRCLRLRVPYLIPCPPSPPCELAAMGRFRGSPSTNALPPPRLPRFQSNQFLPGCQLLALVGFAIALASFDALSSGITSRVAHAATGIVIMCLGLLQPLNALFRPPKHHDGQTHTAARRAWHAVHAGSGWLAIGLSIPTVILGTTFVPSNRGSFQIGYGVAAVSVLALASVSVCDRETIRRNKGGAAARIPQKQHMTDMQIKAEEA